MFSVHPYSIHVGSTTGSDVQECIDITDGRIDYIIREYTKELNNYPVIDLNLADLDKRWQAWKATYSPTFSNRDEFLAACNSYGPEVSDIATKLESIRKEEKESTYIGPIETTPPSYDEPTTKTPSTPSTPSTPGTSPVSSKPSTTTSKPSTFYSPIQSSSGATSKPLWPLLIAAAGIGVVVYSKYGMKHV